MAYRYECSSFLALELFMHTFANTQELVDHLVVLKGLAAHLTNRRESRAS